MRTVGTVLVLGMLVGGCVSTSPGSPPSPFRHPMCDSPEVEEAAFFALDYINNHHKHGYKYALNRIEDVKVIAARAGEVYIVELDLLQTTCHALDPTPLANCTVRPKSEMTIEGDCDVAVSKVNGTLEVKAFKCKSKPDSREDVCLGCPNLLPLNHTDALQVVDLTLAAFNKQSNLTSVFSLLEVARLTSQVVGGGPKIEAEFVIVETSCSGNATEGCVPLQGPKASKAFCKSSSAGQPPSFKIDCKFFQPLPVVEVPTGANDTSGPPHPPHVPVVGGQMHHKLTHLHLHDPSVPSLLSESSESKEVPVVKREAPAAPAHLDGPPPAVGIKRCPGQRRHF